jgi:hypothetical protein
MIVKDVKPGTPVVATYGFNKVLEKPFKFLYEWGYYTSYGCVVYKKGEGNMQDAHVFKINEIEIATKDDIENLSWG